MKKVFLPIILLFLVSIACSFVPVVAVPEPTATNTATVAPTDTSTPVPTETASPTPRPTNTVRPPTRTPRPTPTVVAPSADIVSVLLDHGFVRFKAGDAGCPKTTPCKAYVNSGVEIMAMVYDNGSLVLGLMFIPGSSVDAEAKAALTSKVMLALYPPEVFDWVVEHSQYVADGDQQGDVQGYHLVMGYLPMDDGGGMLAILIVPPAAPGA